MIGNLREAFKDLVRENDWMDAQTKSVAIEKVSFFELMIKQQEFGKVFKTCICH